MKTGRTIYIEQSDESAQFNNKKIVGWIYGCAGGVVDLVGQSGFVGGMGLVGWMSERTEGWIDDLIVKQTFLWADVCLDRYIGC